MFAAAWGERPVELLQLAAARAGVESEHTGSLAVLGAESSTEAGWRCWMAGRLTNAEELCQRFDLPPTTQPSTLIARSYARLGPPACELLRGTFVVVALDRERELAAIVRDHLGGRPLVHFRLGAGGLFAEHERAILEMLPNAPGPDPLALAQWIERGSTPPGRTLFEGIERIPPAHRANLSAGGVAIEPYWRPHYEGVSAGSRAAVAENLRDTAFDAVRRNVEGAQRPGVRLSGGLDSACVAAGLAARRSSGAGALSFAVVFPTHAETDECELIEATARHTGLPVQLLAFDDRASILTPALEHVERWSLPPVTPNLFVWKPLMAVARHLGVDVMLDGEGGDELFGIAPQLIADRLRSGRLLTAWRLTRRIPGVGADADTQTRLQAIRLYGISALVPAGVMRRRRRMRVASSPGSLLRPTDALALLEIADTHSLRLDGPLWWRSLAEDLAGQDEALGISAHLRREASDEGIDRRHPFLFDLELLRTALANPPELQFDPVRDRALLRDGLAGQIPEAVRTRHAKSFFSTLLPAGLAADGPILVRALERADAPVRAFVDAGALEPLLRGGPAHRAARRLWNVGLADVWLRSLERPDYPRELLERTARRV